jgi:fructokinase
MILALGEILFDELPAGRRPGGAPFNFARHLRLLGYPVQFVSAIGGRDSAGVELLRCILNSGLDPNGVQRIPDAASGRVEVQLDPNGVPSYDIICPAAYDFIDFSSLSISEPQLVYFGSLIQRTTNGRKRFQEYLHSLPDATPRFYDVNFRPGCVSEEIVFPSLEQTDLLKLNDEELPIIGKLINSTKQGDDLVDQLRDRFEIQQVVLTCGAKGCALYAQHGKTSFPPGPLRKESIVDTVGAGDAFAAMAAHGFLQNSRPAETLEHATKLAEFVCTISGAVPTDNTIYETLIPLSY